MFWKKKETEEIKYLFKEFPGADYQKYEFPYRVYAELINRENLDKIYQKGFLQSRINSERFYLARSTRIDLTKFDLSSENKRVLNKSDFLELETYSHKFDQFEYQHEIGKMGIDFYKDRFGDKTVSAQKWKWIFSSGVFNEIQVFKDGVNNKIVGYCPSVATDGMLHYAYPFYDLNYLDKNVGMGMMLNSILESQDLGRKYVYLGTCYTESSLYKTQFKGFEWFTGEGWSDDVEKLKEIVRIS